jgi:hypothetical protein
MVSQQLITLEFVSSAAGPDGPSQKRENGRETRKSFSLRWAYPVGGNQPPSGFF